MNTTTKKFYVIGAIVIGLAGIGTLGRMSLAQDTAQSPAVERYRITMVGSDDGRYYSALLLDTKTGRCWEKSSSGNWREETPPGLPTK